MNRAATDPVEEYIDAVVAAAPPMPPTVRHQLSLLVRDRPETQAS